MSRQRSWSLSVLNRFRAQLARVISPTPGDSETETWDIVLIEPSEHEGTTGRSRGFHITGFNESTDSEPGFSETVDEVTINNSQIDILEPVRLDGGVAFEYYWSPDHSKIDFYQ